jgi:hypothetical protein
MNRDDLAFLYSFMVFLGFNNLYSDCTWSYDDSLVGTIQ